MVTKMKRSYTMVYSISCFRNGNCPNYSQLPFPDLDVVKNKQIPMFTVAEELVIDGDKFEAQVGYITHNQQRIYHWSLWLSCIALVCCLLAGCFQFLWLMNTPIKQKVDWNVKRIEEADNQANRIDDNDE